MNYLRAVYVGNEPPLYVPFEFVTRPVVSGPQLDEDLAIYKALSSKCFLMAPTPAMLLFGGESAMTLFLRRAETMNSWLTFQSVFFERNPGFRTRIERARAAVTELVVPFRNGKRRKLTTTQMVCAVVLMSILPPGVSLKLEYPLTPKSESRSDMALIGRPTQCVVRLEVYGMLSRAPSLPITEDASKYSKRQDDRLDSQEKDGIPRPHIIYASDLWDARQMRAVLLAAIEALQTTEAKSSM